MKYQSGVLFIEETWIILNGLLEDVKRDIKADKCLARLNQNFGVCCFLFGFIYNIRLLFFDSVFLDAKMFIPSHIHVVDEICERADVVALIN